jgi:aryl sulfotransferase
MLSRAASRIVKNEAMDSGRWSAYKPRSGDIIIGTAPKVGTHWMLQIVSLLVFQSHKPRDLRFAPWLDAQFLAPLDEMLQMIESQAHRRILLSHLPFDALPIYDEVRYIHLGLDPTVVSPGAISAQITCFGWGLRGIKFSAPARLTKQLCFRQCDKGR